MPALPALPGCQPQAHTERQPFGSAWKACTLFLSHRSIIFLLFFFLSFLEFFVCFGFLVYLFSIEMVVDSLLSSLSSSSNGLGGGSFLLVTSSSTSSSSSSSSSKNMLSTGASRSILQTLWRKYTWNWPSTASQASTDETTELETGPVETATQQTTFAATIMVCLETQANLWDSTPQTLTPSHKTTEQLLLPPTLPSTLTLRCPSAIYSTSDLTSTTSPFPVHSLLSMSSSNTSSNSSSSTSPKRGTFQSQDMQTLQKFTLSVEQIAKGKSPQPTLGTFINSIQFNAMQPHLYQVPDLHIE